MSPLNIKWTEKHFEICKGILRFPAGTHAYGIRLDGSDESLQGCDDADWNADIRDHTSTTGWLVKYKGGVLDGRARSEPFMRSLRQKRSTWRLTERRCLGALGMSDDGLFPTPDAVDHQAAINLAKNKIRRNTSIPESITSDPLSLEKE